MHGAGLASLPGGHTRAEQRADLRHRERRRVADTIDAPAFCGWMEADPGSQRRGSSPSQITRTPSVVSKPTLAHAMFKDVGEQRLAQGKAAEAHVKCQLVDLGKQTDRMLERIVEADSSAVIAAYEKVAELENQKLVVREQLEKKGKPQQALRGIVRTRLRLSVKALSTLVFR